MKYVYDSGALIAIERSRDSTQVTSHEERLAARDQIIVPAPAAAQVVRHPAHQARLMLTLRSCRVIPFSDADVSPVGELLARSGTADVVDGFVALTAALERAAVITSDPDDIGLLLSTMGVRLPVLKP
ncbi:MAG: PIN domain-containing protein [Streptosporangiaceae bacterium]